MSAQEGKGLELNAICIAGVETRLFGSDGSRLSLWAGKAGYLKIRSTAGRYR